MKLPAIIENQPKEIMIFDNKGIIKSTKDGLIRGIEVTVELSLRRKEFYGFEVGTKDNKKNEYKITAEGYDRLYQAAALETAQEPTFNMNGIEYTNPHITFDEKGRKRNVTTRQTIVGRDANGKIQFSSALIIYDAEGLLMTSLMTKIKYDKDESFGFYCDREEFEEYKQKNRRVKFYEIDDDFGICVKTNSYNFKNLIATERDMRDTIERKAVTIARRNAIRRHPAVAKYSVLPEKKYNEDGEYIDLITRVKIMRWMNINDAETDMAIQEYIARSNIMLEPERIDIQTDDEEYMESEGIIVGAEEEFEVSEEAVESMAEKEEAMELKSLVKKANKGYQFLSGDQQNEVKKAFDKKFEDMTIIELHSLNAMINQIIDKKIEGENQ